MCCFCLQRCADRSGTIGSDIKSGRLLSAPHTVTAHLCLFRQITKKLAKGKAPEIIAEELEEKEALVVKICRLIRENPDKSLEETAHMLYAIGAGTLLFIGNSAIARKMRSILRRPLAALFIGLKLELWEILKCGMINMFV